MRGQKKKHPKVLGVEPGVEPPLTCVDYLAERVGFEPTVDLHPRLISSQVHSTTLPPLRCVQLGEQSRMSRQKRHILVKEAILAETGLSR